jgi:AraC-like DNA-binding protein
MDKQSVYIDNMVCDRCKLVVQQVAAGLGWRVEQLDLGRLIGWPPSGQESTVALARLQQQLASLGFRPQDGQQGIISRIKGLIVDYVYNDRVNSSTALSGLISSDIGQSYSHLSRMFSQAEGRTINEFYRLHRVERAKQLLVQTTDPVAIIATRLNYSTASRFTTVFKQDTGLSPTAFRTQGEHIPRPLDGL